MHDKVMGVCVTMYTFLAATVFRHCQKENPLNSSGFFILLSNYLVVSIGCIHHITYQVPVRDDIELPQYSEIKKRCVHLSHINSRQ